MFQVGRPRDEMSVVQAGRPSGREASERLRGNARPMGLRLNWQEKHGAGAQRVPVPQTDTGRQVEYTQVDERTSVKELGNLTPYLRKKGCSLGCRATRPKPAESRSGQAQATG